MTSSLLSSSLGLDAGSFLVVGVVLRNQHVKISGQRESGGTAAGRAPTSTPQFGGKIQEAGLAQLGERQTEVKLREIYLKVMCSIHINRILFSFAEMASAFGLPFCRFVF